MLPVVQPCKKDEEVQDCGSEEGAGPSMGDLQPCSILRGDLLDMRHCRYYERPR